MDLLTRNKLADAMDWLGALDREVTDADFTEAATHGVDLSLAARHYVENYNGHNSFVIQMMDKLTKYKTLTHPQMRASLNVWLKENNPEAARKQATIECFSCHAKFSTWDELMTHKVDEHGAPEPEGPITEDDAGRHAEGVAVIADTSATQGLDLSNLPDGRYAVPNLSRKYMNDADNVFIMVTRLRRTIRRDRRFKYGKIVTGDEIVPQGTIEVKIWSSDAKELIGEQKPGDVYRGELEDELELLMLQPETFAVLFGRLVGRCCICGKTLTDDVSRQIGMGLDCEKKVNYFTTKPAGFEPWCPTCEEQDPPKKTLGVIKGFAYVEGRTKYQCYYDHVWHVRKDGSIVREHDHQH